MSLRGNIERVDRQSVQGWVQDTAAPATPVSLVVSVDDAPVSRVLANVYRQDLERAGLGSGRHGFQIKLEGLSPTTAHTVSVTSEEDGTPVPGSPAIVPATVRFDAGMRDQMAKLLADTESDDELAERAAFLAQQADRLLQLRADRRSHLDRTGQRQFRARWSGRAAAEPEHPPRALVIDDALPDAARDAGSGALLSHMRSLRRLGYDVVFAPAGMAGGAAARALEAEGIACCCAPWTASVEEVLRREAGGFALVYIYRGSNTRYLPLIRYHQPRARVVFSVADLQHVRIARQAEVEQRPELTEASARIRAAELSAARFVDSVVTHSSHEAGLLREALPGARVYVIPGAAEVKPVAAPWAERRGVAFIGHFGLAQNLDAAWWLIQDVMPLVRAQDPSITCILAGSDMPDTVRAAAAPGIDPVGLVALPELLGRVRLTVAPLAFGAGVKGEVAESLAAGVPCVCTPVASEGMELPAALAGVVAGDPRGLAAAILRLHNDQGFNQAVSEAGLAYVAERLSQPRLDAAMREAIGLRALA